MERRRTHLKCWQRVWEMVACRSTVSCTVPKVCPMKSSTCHARYITVINVVIWDPDHEDMLIRLLRLEVSQKHCGNVKVKQNLVINHGSKWKEAGWWRFLLAHYAHLIVSTVAETNSQDSDVDKNQLYWCKSKADGERYHWLHVWPG